MLKINRNDMIANDRDGWAKKMKIQMIGKMIAAGRKKMKKAK